MTVANNVMMSALLPSLMHCRLCMCFNAGMSCCSVQVVADVALADESVQAWASSQACYAQPMSNSSSKQPATQASISSSSSSSSSTQHGIGSLTGGQAAVEGSRQDGGSTAGAAATGNRPVGSVPDQASAVTLPAGLDSKLVGSAKLLFQFSLAEPAKLPPASLCVLQLPFMYAAPLHALLDTEHFSSCNAAVVQELRSRCCAGGAAACAAEGHPGSSGVAVEQHPPALVWPLLPGAVKACMLAGTVLQPHAG